VFNEVTSMDHWGNVTVVERCAEQPQENAPDLLDGSKNILVG
jgi:hypothetical protein